jgi:high-affinity iron transporter
MALVVGIVLAYLGQVKAQAAQRWVWLGVAAAAAVSLVFLGILNTLDQEFEGPTEQPLRGLGTMLLAACFLTWMILWMSRNSRSLKHELQRGVSSALERGGAAGGLFLLVFSPPWCCEGVELALLLFAAPGQGQAARECSRPCGSRRHRRPHLRVRAPRRPLRTFFKVTTILLVVFAAGLVSHAAHEFAGGRSPGRDRRPGGLEHEDVPLRG